MTKRNNYPARLREKRCTQCNRVKGLHLFYKRGDRYSGKCKSCTKKGGNKQWERHLLNVYGLTPEDYRIIYETQGGVCYICRVATGKTKALAVDHDHDTGIIRGLLCSHCNARILGRLGYKGLQRALDYLDTPPAIKALGERKVPDAT